MEPARIFSVFKAEKVHNLHFLTKDGNLWGQTLLLLAQKIHAVSFKHQFPPPVKLYLFCQFSPEG